MTKFAVVLGELAQQVADALVTPADERLSLDSSINWEVFGVAGQDIQTSLRSEFPHGLSAGEVEVTFGYGLAVKYLVLAVAPIRGKPFGSDYLLAECYRKSITEAATAGAKTIVLPLLGTGDFGWPEESAALMAREGILAGLRESPEVKQITFCVDSGSAVEELKTTFGTELKYGLNFMPRCPKCDKEALRITYGLPREEDFEDPDFYSGGCMVGPENRNWVCVECELEFG
jgi:O-acetyl-ADP-ribose deacetylase (regulator of RNase III)